MSDDDEIRALLRRMADDEEFEPVPLVPLMDRGRRGLFRRRVFSAVMAGTAVAAVVMAAAVVPGVLAAEPDAPAAASTRLPGTRPGDAALEPVPVPEALRRCQLQWSAVSGRDVGAITVMSSRLEQQQPTFTKVGMVRPGRPQTVVDAQRQTFVCLIPGDYRPSETDLAIASRDTALPTRKDDLLRRCSTEFWHDLSDWRVVTQQTAGTTLLQAVMLSPSGRYAAHCTISDHATRSVVRAIPVERPLIEVVGNTKGNTKGTNLVTRLSIGANEVLGLQAGSACGMASTGCLSWVFYGSGRVSPQIARMVIKYGAKSETIDVADGWYAVAFETSVNDRDGRPGKVGPLMAYDTNGQLVKTTTYFAVSTG
ncbi:hypothetical protein [Kribbella deserti]|uniref:Ig-like domain-containing protein n=1 Tax=Kribbella deserti TaxID=1926257 RepID=A0ABV6QU83_9ACTN